jgi:hypothetical protein
MLCRESSRDPARRARRLPRVPDVRMSAGAARLAAAQSHRLGGGELLVRQLALQVQFGQLAELARGRRQAGVLRRTCLHERLVLTFLTSPQQRLVLLTFASRPQQGLLLTSATGLQQGLVLLTLATSAQQRLARLTFATSAQQRLARLTCEVAGALTLPSPAAGRLGRRAAHRPAGGEGAADGRGTQQRPAPD